MERKEDPFGDNFQKVTGTPTIKPDYPLGPSSPNGVTYPRIDEVKAQQLTEELRYNLTVSPERHHEAQRLAEHFVTTAYGFLEQYVPKDTPNPCRLDSTQKKCYCNIRQSKSNDRTI